MGINRVNRTPLFRWPPVTMVSGQTNINVNSKSLLILRRIDSLMSVKPCPLFCRGTSANTPSLSCILQLVQALVVGVQSGRAYAIYRKSTVKKMHSCKHSCILFYPAFFVNRICPPGLYTDNKCLHELEYTRKGRACWLGTTTIKRTRLHWH